MPIYLVIYSDDEGPYATAFSTRAKAQEFIDGFLGSRDDFNLIETELDISAADHAWATEKMYREEDAP